MSAVSSRSHARTILFATAIAVVLLAITAARSNAAYTITDFKLTPSPLPTPAGGHPKMHYHVDPDASTAGSDDLKKVVLDFPAGLLGNPEAATPKCVATGTGSANKFASDTCPASSYIGSMLIKWKEPLGNLTSAPGSVYVLSPATAGSAATIGFIVRPQGWRKVFLKTEVGGIVTVRTGTEADYGLTLTVDNIPRTLTSSGGATYPITLSDITVDINSRAGGTSVNTPNGPYFTFNPTRCDAAITRATISSYNSSTAIVKSSSYTPTACSSVKFEPTANVTPTVTTPGAATGVNATFGIPTADAPVQQSHVKSIQVDLPTGTGLNFPAIGAVPATCTETQLNTDACPAGAKIGAVSAVVPFLPPTMTGDVYLLTRNSSITFGYILRGANGVKAPLKGSAAAVDVNGDGASDLVRATAMTMPQVPWTTATISFTSKLINNPTSGCGPSTVTSKLNGWSGATATRTNSWFGSVSCQPPPTVTITGPANNSTTTAATSSVTWTNTGAAPIVCTVNGSAATSPATVNLAIGANTITVTCSNAFGSDSKAVTVTRTPPPFSPTFDQTLSSTTPFTGTDLHWSITNPAGAEGIRRVRFLLDPAISPNYAAYGSNADMCPTYGSTSTTFDPTSCPAQARIGSMTLASTSYGTPITGNAYLIGTLPIPRIGVDFNSSIAGNPAGVSFKIVLNGSSVQIDPACDPVLAECYQQLSYVMQDVPDIGVTAITADLGGISRTGTYGPLDPHPFIFAPVYECTSTSVLTSTAQFTGWASATALKTDTDSLRCPPSITITGPTARYTQATSTTITYTVDPGAGDTPVCTMPSGTTVALAQGPNTFTISCTNSAGTATESVTIVRDNQKPNITITSPLEDAHLSTLGYDNPASWLLYTATDDSGFVSCTPEQSVLSGLSEGANVINVTCNDLAGNTSTASRVVYLDTIAPSVTANCSPQSGTSTTCAISTSEPVTLTCKVNNGPATACTSPFTTNALLTDYLNSITICATDLAGHSNCTIAQVGNPPSDTAVITQYAKPASAPTGSTTVTFSPINAECRVDANVFQPCSSPWTVPTVGLSSQSEHTYDIRAVGQSTTPARGYMWIDSRSYSATATVTAQANTLTTAATAANAGAHPDISATISVVGADDAKDVSVQFPDGLMGSLRSVPVGSRCALADATAGTCPASSQIGTVSTTMEFAKGGAATATGAVYMVDSAGLASQYAAGTAISLKNIPGGHGDLNVLGNLQIVDAARALRLSSTNLPRRTSNFDDFHLLSGSVTIKGDTGGAAAPLITNPHFCGPFNVNRKSPGGVTANNFWGTATSYEGNTTPEVTAPYNVTNCSALPLNPTFSTSFSSLAAGSSTTMTSTLTLPNDSATIRNVQVKLPSFIAPDFTSFGPASEQCSAGAYTGGATGSYAQSASAFGTSTVAYREFVPANCPPQALIGTATITSPLVPGALTADVYLINSSPIPNIGIFVDPTKYGNPQGIKIGIYGTSSTPQVDPTCDPTTDTCPTQISVNFTSLPDVPVSSLVLKFGGMTGRASGPNALLVATAEDPACVNAGENLTASFLPWGSTTSVPRSQLIAPTGCNQ
jgi:hypothetical protein